MVSTFPNEKYKSARRPLRLAQVSATPKRPRGECGKHTDRGTRLHWVVTAGRTAVQGVLVRRSTVQDTSVGRRLKKGQGSLENCAGEQNGGALSISISTCMVMRMIFALNVFWCRCDVLSVRPLTLDPPLIDGIPPCVPSCRSAFYRTNPHRISQSQTHTHTEGRGWDLTRGHHGVVVAMRGA